MSKRCFRCLRTFDLNPDNWHKDRTRPDGWDNKCKECKADYRRSLYERNAESEKALSRKWRQDNPDGARAQHTLRRARKFDNGPTEIINFSEVYHRDFGICGLCYAKVDINVPYPDPGYGTIDHIIPLSKGGPHTYDNVQLAHFVCNSRKGNKQ